MKVKRSDRLVDMTATLLGQPYELISLSEFSKKFQAAKSSISEDLAIIKERFLAQGRGQIQTVAGAHGGVRYIPLLSSQIQGEIVQELIDELNDSKRVLPGDIVYLTDIICQPSWLRKIGALIASHYQDQQIERIMTVATSGIPIAQAVANVLNVPFVIVTRDSKVTEGSTVSINYVSGTNDRRLEKMELSRRSLRAGERVLIVDDFIKSGGTIEGMISLLSEFKAVLVGACALAEHNNQPDPHANTFYQSLIKINQIDKQSKKIQVEAGTILNT